MATTIGTTTIPSDEITIDSGSTVSIGLAFERTVGFVGGMDTSNGSATAGSVVEVSNPTEAANQFGNDSELHRAAKIAFQSTVDTVYAVGVTETDATYQSSSDETSGTLSNTPAFDPNLHGDETITATDDASNTITVNIVYDESPTQPTSADTINLNPHNGSWQADASDTYTINYTYGDYSQSVIETLMTKDPRFVAIGTETETVGSNLATVLGNEANDFVFSHGVIGTPPVEDAETTSTWTSNYSDTLDDKRLSVVSPPRGYTDTAETNQVRTVWGYAAQHAAAPLGESMTKSDLEGYEALRSDFSISDAETLIGSQVAPLRDLPPVEISKDQTTSTDVEFERVYANQIADDGTERLHVIANNFIGNNFNTEASRRRLSRSLRNEYLAMESNTPPLLDSFSVSVTPDATDDNQVDVSVGLDIVDIVDTVDASITIGDVIRNTSE